MSMTREEAIRSLRVKRDCYYPHCEYYEALTMAIDALRSQEKDPQQPLTMAELRKMHGETVYCLELNTDVKITAPKAGFINISYGIPGESGTFRANGMTLYRCRPEEERE